MRGISAANPNLFTPWNNLRCLLLAHVRNYIDVYWATLSKLVGPTLSTVPECTVWHKWSAEAAAVKS